MKTLEQIEKARKRTRDIFQAQGDQLHPAQQAMISAINMTLRWVLDAAPKGNVVDRLLRGACPQVATDEDVQDASERLNDYIRKDRDDNS